MVIIGSILKWLLNENRDILIQNCGDCNVILISIDTLRADYNSLAKIDQSLTPNLDRLTRKGIVFTQAVSASSWTLPSTMSIMTGTYPSRHKVTNKYMIDSAKEDDIQIMNLKKLSPDLVTLAEVFRQNDYRTAGFTGGAGVGREFGFDQGFEEYFDSINFGGFKDTIPRSLEWINAHKQEKFFVFLHGYDVHGQYEPEGGLDYRYVPKSYSGTYTGNKDEQKELREEGLEKGQLFLKPEDIDFWKRIYAEKVERADYELAKFFEKYRDLGLTDKTVFVITSDHGEEFMEHGRLDHGPTLYNETIKVPLIMIIPRAKPAKVSNLVGNMDIFQTIIKVINLKENCCPGQFAAETNLLSSSPWRLKDNNSSVFFETEYRYYVDLKGVQIGSLKLINNFLNPKNELYNLQKNPQETDNLYLEYIRKNPDKINKLENFLRQEAK